MNKILLIQMQDRIRNCAVCGDACDDHNHGIAFFEGLPVANDWPGDWVGRDVCLDCFKRHAEGKMDMWTASDWWDMHRHLQPEYQI